MNHVVAQFQSIWRAFEGQELLAEEGIPSLVQGTGSYVYELRVYPDQAERAARIFARGW